MNMMHYINGMLTHGSLLCLGHSLVAQQLKILMEHLLRQTDHIARQICLLKMDFLIRLGASIGTVHVQAVGVTVITHQPIECLSQAWLKLDHCFATFHRPVYQAGGLVPSVDVRGLRQEVAILVLRFEPAAYVYGWNKTSGFIDL